MPHFTLVLFWTVRIHLNSCNSFNSVDKSANVTFYTKSLMLNFIPRSKEHYFSHLHGRHLYYSIHLSMVESQPRDGACVSGPGWKTTAIGCAVVREICVFRHHGDPVKAPPQKRCSFFQSEERCNSKRYDKTVSIPLNISSFFFTCLH